MAWKKVLVSGPAGLIPEGVEQECVYEWAQYTTVPAGAMKGRKISEFLFMIPNGTWMAGSPRIRGMIMARMKKQGFTPGVHDLFLALPASGRHGLFTEMKRQGPGKYSEDQRIFALSMMQAGYACMLARGFERASRGILSYLNGNGLPADLVFPVDKKTSGRRK